MKKWIDKYRPASHKVELLRRQREEWTKLAVDYASKKDVGMVWTQQHEGKWEPVYVEEPDHRLEEVQFLLDQNARQIAAAMGVPEEHLMPVYPLNPDGRPVTVQRGVSNYDENGNRISVPDNDAIDAVGRIARQMVANGMPIAPAVHQQMRDELEQQSEFDRLPVGTRQEIHTIETEEWEIVARTTTSRRRRTAKAGRANVSGPTTKNDPVFVWGMQSSKPRNGGHFITYEVRLNDDGSTSCNCPGWIFKKKTDDRGCKHTRHPEVVNNAKDYFERHKRGEQLPTIDPPAGAQSSATTQPVTPTAKDQMQGFGRLIILDD